MYFPDVKGESRPWIKLDAQDGVFKVSKPEGDEQVIDTEGLEIGLDLYNAKQGWLAFINGSRDWQPLDRKDEWGERPSPEHRYGVKLDLISRDEAFGDEPVRVLCAASLAVKKFVLSVDQAVGGNFDDPDVIQTIRIKGISTRAIGKGSSVIVDFTVVPRDDWIRRDEVASEVEKADPHDDADVWA